LVDTAKGKSGGIEKSVFKVQSYDWKREQWLDDTVVLEDIRDLLSAGARHVAYYPDNPLLDRPGLRKIKLEMSTESYPFMP
jgi:biofilm PGA synthesis lipoprotein PgaB